MIKVHLDMLLVLLNVTIEPSNVRKKKIKGTIKYDKSTVTCDIDITQCDIDITQCDNGAVKCEKKLSYHRT